MYNTGIFSISNRAGSAWTSLQYRGSHFRASSIPELADAPPTSSRHPNSSTAVRPLMWVQTRHLSSACKPQVAMPHQPHPYPLTNCLVGDSALCSNAINWPRLKRFWCIARLSSCGLSLTAATYMEAEHPEDDALRERAAPQGGSQKHSLETD